MLKTLSTYGLKHVNSINERDDFVVDHWKAFVLTGFVIWDFSKHIWIDI